MLLDGLSLETLKWLLAAVAALVAIGYVLYRQPTWLSLETFKWLLATAAIPVTLAVVSSQYQSAQTERQAQFQSAETERQASDARLRLYTELLSKREEADTGVRKGIFDKVLDTYLKPAGQDLQGKLVALELLALNFNDSLDLSPLFWQLDREIRQQAQPEKRASLSDQLQRITNAVKDRQSEVLESVGANRGVKIIFNDLDKPGPPPINEDLSFPDPDPSAPKGKELTRHFTVEVAEHDAAGRRVLVFVTHTDVNGKGRLLSFWVDVFDFPLTNFTRISKSERFTVLLKRYYPGTGADLALIYFPSARSGIKDKPFIDEVISDLRRGTK